MGIKAGVNVYAYVSSTPTSGFDSDGLWRSELKPDQKQIEEQRRKEQEARDREQSMKDIQKELDEVNDLIWWVKIALICTGGYIGGGAAGAVGAGIGGVVGL